MKFTTFLLVGLATLAVAYLLSHSRLTRHDPRPGLRELLPDILVGREVVNPRPEQLERAARMWESAGDKEKAARLREQAKAARRGRGR